MTREERHLDFHRPVFLDLVLSCGCREPGRRTMMPTSGFLLVHAGMRRQCERGHGEVTITKSTMTLLTEPTRWVTFLRLRPGMQVWDWRQRKWVSIERVDFNDHSIKLEGRRRWVGDFTKDEEVCVLVDPEEMTPEARAAYEATRT